MESSSIEQRVAPVAMFAFNRPELTARVFQRVRAAAPSKLLVVTDGPRASRPGEAELCKRTRAVLEQVDWPCEVRRLYADENMGCKTRLVTGMRWVFEQVPEAIILEDDCLPHPTFFRFCTELLERYRDDQRVMVVSGDNFQRAPRRNGDSYYFSNLVHIWGWATWARAWRHYDPELTAWPEIRDQQWLSDLLADPEQVAFWTSVMEDMHRHRRDTWDYQWVLSVWAQGGLSILPGVNLVENLGFGPDATHTTGTVNPLHEPAVAIPFPLRHPAFFIVDRRADRQTLLRQSGTPPPRRLIERPLTLLRALRRSLRERSTPG